MKNTVFTGSSVAIVTPFTQDGVNFDKLGELIDFQINNLTDAILICGTTGETPTMSEDEHLSAIEFTVKKVANRVPVIAGTGSNNTQHAIKLSKKAQEAGADAVLCVTPYYNKATQRGLYEHFKIIAQSISISMILYNVPTRTNVNINPDTVNALAQVNNIVAIKECNLSQVADIASSCPEDFSIYCGNDEQVVPFMSLGAKGVISVMANVVPKDTHELAVEFLKGNIESSRKIQLKLLDLIKALFIEVSPVPVKEALNLMGMEVGNCRMPLLTMEEKNLEILVQTMKKYGLI